MSDSPRWHLDGLPGTTGIVEVMLYADHLAAVAAATENAVRDYAEAHYANGVKRYSDGVKAAREAVAALYMHAYPGEYGQLADALAAIDGVCPCGGVGSGCRCEKEKP